MGMRFVAAITALIVVGSPVIAHAEAGGNSMCLETAIELHRSGQLDTASDGDRARAVELVQQDIQACLTFYVLDECTGPAAEWVESWNALELTSTSGEDSDLTPSSALPNPSLLQLHAPFTKSAADYFAAMPFASVGATR